MRPETMRIELLPDGIEVRYHGSRTEWHGLYLARRCVCDVRCDPHNRSCTACLQARVEECPQDGVRYLLAGGGRLMYHVRRCSITPTNPAEITRPARVGDRGFAYLGREFQLPVTVTLENDLNPDLIAVKHASQETWVSRSLFSRVKHL